ncbi:hypothetical protein [Tardiphaga sp.]|uniref:hypothetical protein n=1 Tax=Tardiphaga sp. TaxID=1926292 RepID=UPI00260B4A4B|nr:hypothetical protein [Tardiphaga sp.]
MSIGHLIVGSQQNIVFIETFKPGPIRWKAQKREFWFDSAGIDVPVSKLSAFTAMTPYLRRSDWLFQGLGARHGDHESIAECHQNLIFETP